MLVVVFASCTYNEAAVHTHTHIQIHAHTVSRNGRREHGKHAIADCLHTDDHLCCFAFVLYDSEILHTDRKIFSGILCYKIMFRMKCM